VSLRFTAASDTVNDTEQVCAVVTRLSSNEFEPHAGHRPSALPSPFFSTRRTYQLVQLINTSKETQLLQQLCHKGVPRSTWPLLLSVGRRMIWLSHGEKKSCGSVRQPHCCQHAMSSAKCNATLLTLLLLGPLHSLQCSRTILEKLTVAQKCRDLYGTRNFATLFTKSRHWILS